MNSQKDKFIEKYNSIDFNAIRDHPNILIAAGFWENDRFCAAKTCYRFMREIDDLIDNHKASFRTIADEEKNEFYKSVNDWLKMITSAEECSATQQDLRETIRSFRIPSWPLESFAKSMIYDIFHDGFPTMETFIDYARGASVAPASIFVHLAGLVKEDCLYRNPYFDVKEAATPCAIFSYLVHIIRDFQKDHKNHLNYFADDLVAQHGLTRNDLNDIAHGAHITVNFRNLIGDYYRLADEYRNRTLAVISKIRPLLEPAYQLSLEVIFDLYLMVFERIDVQNGKFTTEELNPTPQETRERVYQLIMNFNPF
ncbi:MAG: squalene/phytoene synthase family protein [Bacteroidales bacterium]|nr:squalene/phytoene synthase family protein [Bacteroidales bacterium]